MSRIVFEQVGLILKLLHFQSYLSSIWCNRNLKPNNWVMFVFYWCIISYLLLIKVAKINDQLETLGLGKKNRIVNFFFEESFISKTNLYWTSEKISSLFNEVKIRGPDQGLGPIPA